MRVLHCIPSMEGGGAERQLTYLCAELVRQGCEVGVALTRGGPNLERLEKSGARVYALGSASSYDPRLFFQLDRTIASFRPDIVQCWLLQMEVAGGLAAVNRGVPWLFSERSSAGAYPRTPKNALRRAVVRLASGIVSNSAGGDDYWRQRARASQPRYIVPNGLPIEEIAAAPAADLASSFGLAGPAILFAGRFDEGKNPAAVVRALGSMQTPAAAVLCGEGPGRDELERLVREQGLGERVRIAGFATDLWSLLKGVAVLVSPSMFEGSPNVVLEAMACECPLVVSDIPAHREILDEHCAFFVDPGDPRRLAQVLDGVLTDPVGARARALQAREGAERYTTAAMTQQYLRIYEDVLRRRGGSTRGRAFR